MDPLRWWTKEHGELAPVGHALRPRYSERWTRFHSLPESKRYPSTKGEMGEVLRRATTVANALFKAGEVIYVYISNFRYEDSLAPESQTIAGVVTDNGSVILRANPDDVPSEDDDIFTTWARRDAWPLGFFEELIRQVARAKVGLVCLASPESGNVFCPYDGGMDTFSSSKEVRDSLRSFRSWMSPRSDGL